MSRWLDEAVMLAATLEREMDSEDDSEAPPEDMDYDDAVARLNTNLPEGLRVVAEGPGFTWQLNINGRPMTVYKTSTNPARITGEISGIKFRTDSTPIMTVVSVKRPRFISVKLLTPSK